MKKLLIITTCLFSFNLFAKCEGENLEIKDIQKFFKNGEMKSKYFTTLNLNKKVRRCNQFSGCEEWSSPKATLALGEVVSSIDSETIYRFFPLQGEVYFKVSPLGELHLVIDFPQLDISAKVNYHVGNSTISLNSNQYFRPSGAHIHPISYASYYDEEERFPFSLKGKLTKNCMELKAEFTQNRRGILYDEYEIDFSGKF